MRRVTKLAAAAGLALVATAAEAEPVDTAVAESMVAMARHFGPGEVSAALRFLNDAPDALSAATMGQVLVLRGQFDYAAVFYTLAASNDDPVSLNNLAALLALLADAEPETWPDTFLETAQVLAETAVADEPGIAEFHNTLGSIARLRDDHPTARDAHSRAIEINPREVLFHANLARDLAAMGDHAGAGSALEAAHRIAPADPAVRFLRADLPDLPVYAAAVRNDCDVNFRCDEICPKSIIGGLLNVQCEMENMSARVACDEGRPFARSYDCNEDFPEYGILIPGLNSGFTAFGPGFKVHVLFNGDGQIDFRWEINTDFGPYGMLGAHIGSDGHYPRDGTVVLDNFRAGLDFEIMNGSNKELDPLDDLDIPFARILQREGEGVSEMPVTDFDRAVITF